MTQIDALKIAADMENTAIFTYGIATAFAGGERGTVAEFIAAHRVRRDEVNTLILAAGEAERTPAPGYTLPFEVTDASSAAKALLAAENETARAYRSLLEQAEEPKVRRLGVDGLSECALRIAHWRGVLGVTPSTLALPGQNDR